MVLLGAYLGRARVVPTLIEVRDSMSTLGDVRDSVASAFAPAPTTTVSPIQPPVTAPIPWARELRVAYDRSMADAVTSQFAGLEMADVHSKQLTIEQGVRATWQPPGDACAEPVLVWAFGGSAMFGFQLRDDHTIPSELARVAWEDGIAITVVNHAVPGDVMWQELQRLRRALATTDRPPDAVITYDGYNDLRAAESSEGEGDAQALSDLFLLPAVGALRWDGDRWAAPSEEIDVDPPESELTPVRAASQFGSAHAGFAREAAEEGFALTSFHQPWVATVWPPVSWPPVDPAHRDQVDRFRSLLPREVVDLGDIFDGKSERMFIDDVHTTEAASRLIAARMWAAIHDDVVARAAVDDCGG